MVTSECELGPTLLFTAMIGNQPPKASKCLICDQKQWISELDSANYQWDKLDTDLDKTLEPVHAFQALIKSFLPCCQKCKGLPLVCLLGRTGSGKSTLLNILAGCKPTYGKSTLGTREIQFEKGVCEVGGGVSSLTKFCYCHRIEDAIYIDFAGFFDNRAGQLQVVQHLLLHYITYKRSFKVLAVKDIRITRDLPFIEFLNLDWVTKKNTLVVMTHTYQLLTIVKATTRWIGTDIVKDGSRRISKSV